MRASFLFLPCAAALAAVVGCGSSHTSEEDAGDDIMFDASLPDAGMDATMRDARVPVCGDGRLDPMESCDDGNTEDGDGCDSSCRRESFCGDGELDPDEVCDDGNNRSGDGCRADCQSDETCGNGVRDVIVGEQCDDGNTEDGDGCSADCTIVESCGDGTIDADAGETCDDGNTDPYDGCGADCRVEVAVVINELEIGGPMVGCDYTGNGEPDNSLARALGPGVDLINGMFGEEELADFLMLMQFLGLDDPEGIDDDDVSVAWLQGEDSDDDATNNLSGDADLLINPDSLEDDGRPVASFASRIMSRMLMGGPEDIELPIGGFFPFELKQGRVHATTTAAAGEMNGLTEGLLCGALPMSTLATVPNLIDLLGSMAGIEAPPPCDGSGDLGSMADLLAGGTEVIGISIGGVQPDVDLDGDGLEWFEIDNTSDDGSTCSGVIVACIDGDGTRVEGRGCAMDPRFQDGYSTGLPFAATGANIVGVAGADGDGDAP